MFSELAAPSQLASREVPIALPPAQKANSFEYGSSGSDRMVGVFGGG
jgi:hypothetical protein